MRDSELRFKQIGNFLFRSDQVISEWCKDFEERRMASMFSGHANNENAAKLTKEQKKEIKL